MNMPKQEASYWIDSKDNFTYPALTEDLSVDVAIVGGGIAGLTAAYLLKQTGLTVAVIEKNSIGSGTTGGTTGKVTSQHNLVYDDLIKRLGEKGARLYADANQTAVESIIKLIRDEKVDCDWEQQDNYVYTTQPKRVEQLKSEAKAAARLGLPASFETKLDLPFEVAGAVKFAGQGRIHATKYTQTLAAIVQGGGSYVFENSNVTKIEDGEPAAVGTDAATVTAKNVIVASKVPAWPLMARFTYAALEYPHTSYVLAAKLESSLQGMYISPDKNHYSILPVHMGAEKLLLIGGENHVPGLGRATRRHQKLAEYASKHFGSTVFPYRWKAMDYLVYDDLPLIGKVYPWSKHLYTATGFRKWGMSFSMVAGMILRDLITGQKNPWASLFDSTRLRPVLSIPRAIIKH